jgi:hypothetical protein
MLQVVSAVASSAPAVYKKADALAKKISNGKGLKDLVQRENGSALTGELLVKSGMPVERLRALMDGFAVHDARDVYAHAVRFVSNEVAAVSAAAVQVRSEGLSESVRDDIVCAQIKSVIELTGLGNVSNLMKVATVLSTLTAKDVKTYKDKGVISPKLGYN